MIRPLGYGGRQLADGDALLHHDDMVPGPAFYQDHRKEHNFTRL